MDFFTRMQLSVDRAFQTLSRPMSELLGVTEKDFELPEEAEEEQIFIKTTTVNYIIYSSTNLFPSEGGEK